MAKITGSTGKSSRMLADRRDIQRLLLRVILAIVSLVLLWLLLKFGASGPSVVTFIILLVLLGAIKWLDRMTDRTDRHLRKRTRDAERGAKGEDAVGALLASLPDEYAVFHDLSRLAGDIDHIVVGPTGLFVIETKAHGGKVTIRDNRLLVNGKPPEKDFIAQVWRNAYWVRDLLKNTADLVVEVTPILVFPNAFVTGRGMKGVRVINKKYLTKIILDARAVNLPVERVSGVLQQKMTAAADDHLEIELKD